MHIFYVAVVLQASAQVVTRSNAGFVHAQRAQELMQAQRNAEALKEWKLALRGEPRNATYHNLYGLALQAAGQPADARKEFQQAIQLRPGFADAHSNLAYSLWIQGEEQAASEEFDRALKIRPSDPALHLARGLLGTFTGGTAEACRHFDRARPWPNDADTLWSIFAAYLTCSQLKEALEAAGSLPRDGKTQLAIGQTLLSLHQGKSALSFLHAAKTAESLSPGPILALAEAYLDMGQPEDALSELNQLTESDRLLFPVLEIWGSSLLKLGRRSEAQEQFQKLVMAYPNDPEAYVNATQIPLEDQDWNKALEILSAGLERIPNNWLLLFRRAMTYKLSRRLAEARTDLLKAVSTGGDVPLLAAALGEVYAAQGDMLSAAEVFHKTFVETGRPEFQFAYALALERQGDYARGLRELKIAAGLLPNDARVRYEYGKLLQRAGQVTAARHEFERARSLDPALSRNLYALSRLYATLGEQDLAAKTAKEFLATKQKRGVNPQ